MASPRSSLSVTRRESPSSQVITHGLTVSFISTSLPAIAQHIEHCLACKLIEYLHCRLSRRAYMGSAYSFWICIGEGPSLHIGRSTTTPEAKRADPDAGPDTSRVPTGRARDRQPLQIVARPPSRLYKTCARRPQVRLLQASLALTATIS